MKYLSLTAPERRALTFLLCILAAGSAVYIWKRVSPEDLTGYRLEVRHTDVEKAPAVSAAAEKLKSGIDPNVAPQEDLELLPGIGPELARRIVAARSPLDPFREPEDLLRVPGIGPKSAERLTPYLSFP